MEISYIHSQPITRRWNTYLKSSDKCAALFDGKIQCLQEMQLLVQNRLQQHYITTECEDHDYPSHGISLQPVNLEQTSSILYAMGTPPHTTREDDSNLRSDQEQQEEIPETPALIQLPEESSSPSPSIPSQTLELKENIGQWIAETAVMEQENLSQTEINVPCSPVPQAQEMALWMF